MTVQDQKVGGKKALDPQPSLPTEANATEAVDTADRLLDKMLNLTPEEEEEAALEEMRRDPSAPLTNFVLRLLLKPEEVSRIAEIVLPHLCNDSWSRTTLREALLFNGASPDKHPAFALLKQAEPAEQEQRLAARPNPNGNVDPGGGVYNIAEALAVLDQLSEPQYQVTEEQWEIFKKGIDQARPGQRSIYGEGYNPPVNPSSTEKAIENKAPE